MFWLTGVSFTDFISSQMSISASKISDTLLKHPISSALSLSIRLEGDVLHLQIIPVKTYHAIILSTLADKVKNPK